MNVSWRFAKLYTRLCQQIRTIRAPLRGNVSRALLPWIQSRSESTPRLPKWIITRRDDRLTLCCRNAILSTAARELEFTVHSLCRTTEGYNERAAEKVRAVKLLPRAEAWSGSGGSGEYEDAREVVDALRQVCQRMCGKGKGKAR